MGHRKSESTFQSCIPVGSGNSTCDLCDLTFLFELCSSAQYFSKVSLLHLSFKYFWVLIKTNWINKKLSAISVNPFTPFTAGKENTSILGKTSPTKPTQRCFSCQTTLSKWTPTETHFRIGPCTDQEHTSTLSWMFHTGQFWVTLPGQMPAHFSHLWIP